VAFRPGRHSWLARHRDPALVGVSYTVPVESSFLHSIGTDELSKEGTFRFRRSSCEQRRKHPNVALLPRIVNFFSLNFAATLSPQSVIPSDRIGWDSEGAAVRNAAAYSEAQLPEARALGGKFATALP